MTHSNTINSTITKETEATKARAGSSKSESIQSKSNTDFLADHKNDDLALNSVEGEIVVTIKPPKHGWTYDALTGIDFWKYSEEHASWGWDIYLGGVHLGNDDQWIFG
ncbi:hypothetical protein [Aliivibrio wodanis]|uniref:hypothetical protein n=1 Tax=Aliivibrio wodanis TaxID=80852 RepID=UPI00406C438B